ncbi:mitogen-activated protein kinase 15 [Ischnura elegans]|uniref:mitogen-activated protein kinase 15 n=1 Tax=Ischnura elegans TaxID=197161 RepID=UPI001ED8B8C0|nr:mitogen-activated protein kinase 15 [Ischnura elegans]
MNLPIKEVDNHMTRRYEIGKRLGKGAYGIVWKAIDRKTNEKVAVKKIFDAFRNPTDAQRTFREIMFLKAFGAHPNIITLRSIHKAKNDKDIYLVFEYMDSDLHNVIKKGNVLKEIHIQFILYQLLKATKYIHSGGVVHRDQKPSNVLIDVNCHCKLADFGLARSLNPHDKINGQGTPEIVDPSLTDYVATRWYRAPEILVASKRYTKGVDMWSLGCILAEMLLGKPIFPGSSTINQVELIMNTIPKPSHEDIENVCSGYGMTLLEKTPTSPQKTFRQILKNVRKDAVDLVEKLLVFNPSKRLSAIEALDHPYVHRFHRVKDEPSMHSRVVPPLRDDVRLGVDDYRSNLYEFIRVRQAMAQQAAMSIKKEMPVTSPNDSKTFQEMNTKTKEVQSCSPKTSTPAQITRSGKETISKPLSSIVRRNVSAQDLRSNEKQEVITKRTSTSDSGIKFQVHSSSSPQKHVRPGIRKSYEPRKVVPIKEQLRETMHHIEGDGRKFLRVGNQTTAKEKISLRNKPQAMSQVVQKALEKSKKEARSHSSTLQQISFNHGKTLPKTIIHKYIGN